MSIMNFYDITCAKYEFDLSWFKGQIWILPCALGAAELGMHGVQLHTQFLSCFLQKRLNFCLKILDIVIHILVSYAALVQEFMF